MIVDNALFGRLFAEEKVLDFNDWGVGVRPTQITTEMVQICSAYPKVGTRRSTEQRDSNDIRVCVLGDQDTGRTALIIQYYSSHFVEEYDPTIEDWFRKQIKLFGAEVVVEIFDTTNMLDFSADRRKCLLESEIIVLCVDMSRPAKVMFDYACRVLEHERIRGHPDLKLNPEYGDELMGLPVLLVATKCDLPRQFSGQELVAFAKTYRMGLIVTSAKNNTRVADVFEECARYGVARRWSESTMQKTTKTGKGCALM
jgi:GTPase KRas protein